MEDVTRAVIATENALRELILTVLEFPGDDAWTVTAGVSSERVAIWEERRVEEGKRRDAVLERRLLYFSDLPDLRKIIERRWELFKPALDSKAAFAVDMERLEAIRVALAHGRELLPHEEADVAAISARIRRAVTMYRTRSGTGEKRYFPRIEAAYDSLGNARERGEVVVSTNTYLRPGDLVHFEVRGLDPDGLPSTVRWKRKRARFTDEGVAVEGGFDWEVTEADIGSFAGVEIELVSSRSYHRYNTRDDFVEFHYTVLPVD